MDLDQGDFLTATKMLNTSIRLEPDNYELYLERSICHFKLGNYQASLDDANIAIRLNPNDYTIHHQRGLALSWLKKFSEAVTSFKKAIELRAKQEDSKLSDIFRLMKDASFELQAAKEARIRVARPESPQARDEPIGIHQEAAGTPTPTATTTTISTTASSAATSALGGAGTGASNASAGQSIGPHHLHRVNNLKLDRHHYIDAQHLLSTTNDPVDSTTDRPIALPQAQQQPPPSQPFSIQSASSSSASSAGILAKLSQALPKQQASPIAPIPSLGHQLTASPIILPTAPSSSMQASAPAMPINDSSSSSTSYSSKYKRLRRDRERARRGTSKLCTIKPIDLEELKRNKDQNTMRVIAPIDGWLYSGQLSVDPNSLSSNDFNAIPKYIVKLDGDTTGGSYLFNHDTVLNDVIKEVRVNSVSDLRKGARICCYWSRQYKCLSTGVVTSRTFEATKSLVSVKYDNGDLSALPLEDLRLLPPDYPKYMSNCDPLFLARSGSSNHQEMPINVDVEAEDEDENHDGDGDHNMSNNINVCTEDNISDKVVDVPGVKMEQSELMDNSPIEERTNDSNGLVHHHHHLIDHHQIQRHSHHHDHLHHHQQQQLQMEEDEPQEHEQPLEDETIPPTDETMQLIIDESNNEQKDTDVMLDHVDRVSITDISRTSSEKSNSINSGVEYRPWIFDGQPRRSKRHGRTYRDYYTSIRRGQEVIKVGDTAELMPRDESILPFIAKIDGLWATGRGEMRVRVRWYYRLIETGGEPFELQDGENALFETDHFDENDVQSIYRSTKILSWTEYSKIDLEQNDTTPKIFYLAGSYDPVRRIKHLRPDVKEALTTS